MSFATKRRSRLVLVVDDDPIVREHLTSLLVPRGYAVTAVDSIRAARAAVEQTFFPIAIVDRGLTDGDGLALCEELRTGTPPNRVFVVVFSGRDDGVEVGRGLRAGADVYLSKRTSEAELLAYLDAAVLVDQFASGEGNGR